MNGEKDDERGEGLGKCKPEAALEEADIQCSIDAAELVEGILGERKDLPDPAERVFSGERRGWTSTNERKNHI